MSQRVQDLVERFKAFNDELIRFVETCTKAQWKKECAEEWRLGVVARHIAAGHYSGAADMTRMIVEVEKMPALNMEQIIEMANAHAREHVDCSREEVLDLLRSNGTAFANYLEGLDDTELDLSTHVELVGGEISAQKLIEMVVFESGGEHFTNMKKAF